MAKKKVKNTKLSGQEKVAYNRWEFLRMNKSYQKDFKDKFINCSKPAPEYSENKVEKKKYKYFRQKYSIEFPINPKYSYGELSAYVGGIKPKLIMREFGVIFAFKELHSIAMGKSLLTKDREIRLLANTDSVIFSHLVDHCNITIDKKDDEIILYKFWEKDGKYFTKIIDPKETEDIDVSRVMIAFDISKPTPEIVKAFKGVLGGWKNVYKKAHGERMQFDIYDRYRKIYSLRNKPLRIIAETVYPKEYKQVMKFYHNKYDFEPLFEKIKANLKAAEKLVNGGYKKIR